MAVIRISIVEDDDEARNMLAVLFNGTPGFRCVSAHHSAEDALEKLPVKKCDVVLLDLGLPGMDGVECARALRSLRPEVLIVVFTIHEQDEKVFESLKAGACGYILKKTPLARLVEGIQEAVAGGSPMSPAIARKVTRHFQDLPATESDPGSLSDREREILDHIARGRKNMEIAGLLKISHHTVDSYIRRIYEKLEVSSRAEAVSRYLRR